MDEAAAPGIAEDGAEKRPDNGDNASENYVCTSTEDTADSKYLEVVILNVNWTINALSLCLGVTLATSYINLCAGTWNNCAKVTILGQIHNANN